MNSTAVASTGTENATGSLRIALSKAEGIAFILQFVLIVVGNLLTIVLLAVNRRPVK